MFYRVTTIVDGALDTETDVTPPDDAAEYAEHEEAELVRLERIGQISSWAVYVVPHYCSEHGECTCMQWVQDHTPFASDVERFEATHA